MSGDSLFDQALEAAPAEPVRPREITVTAGGVAHAWLVKHLALDSAKLFQLHGDELGAPRDYVYRRGEYFYTPAGVRAIVRICGLEVEVHEGFELAEVPLARAEKKPWWEEDRR